MKYRTILGYAKLIHAVKMAQFHFVVKMEYVVMKILSSMELMTMNANVSVLITSQVRSLHLT